MEALDLIPLCGTCEVNSNQGISPRNLKSVILALAASPSIMGKTGDVTDYLYKALDAQGQFVSGRLQAASPIAAVQQLIELGYVPLDTNRTPSAAASLVLHSQMLPSGRLLSCSRISLCCCDRDYR